MIESAFLEFEDHFGRSCKLYAERCLISQGKAPALVHCPGGGQTVNRLDLLDWARKGFCCVSFDWQIGDFPHHDPCKKSCWPEGVVGQTAFIDKEEDAILPLAVESAGVCIDWLIQSPHVDPEAIGVTGISWGGYLTWLIAASDPRIKAAVPVYGCGGHFDERHPASLSASAEMATRWKSNWDPFLIFNRQRKPICYLSCTNDFFGILPLANELLNNLEVPRRRGWMPNCNHTIGPGESALGLAWFKHYLDNGPALPAEPVLGDDLEIDADSLESVSQMEVWWTPALSAGDLGCWIKGIPAANASAAYGRVHYKEGYTLSTPLKFLGPSASSATLPETYPDLGNGIGWDWGMGSTQFHGNQVMMENIGGGRMHLFKDPGNKGDAPSFFLNQFAHPDWNTGQTHRITLGLETVPWQEFRELRVTLKFAESGSIREVTATLPLIDDTLAIVLPRFPGVADTLTWRDIVRVQISFKSGANSFLIGPLRRWDPS